ncbi:glycosyltransferase family 2 protein [Pseudanabaena sp. FACHB-1277]|uniref:Glycosyltransferase family 2 protein n=1 Tax=Pseudanabaena cinerea FACHB-1277 TaxID=2949581 RepID=A0A926UT27_9CYAN|nr:glycosyltransferase [Pseudanabaena cinerea]MBD2150286.1 glycosyltransferase family 2 protein [Pseudanabaena cinerea FACHB-1277]
MLNISVVIPTYKRLKVLQLCLEKILTSNPLPSEIVIHIDFGDQETKNFLVQKQYSLVRWITSETTQGPGGGRNKLIREAKYPIIASFDDDSWPISPDYFQVALDTFAKYPKAAVISAQEIRRNSRQLNQSKSDRIQEVSCFQNCACLIRKEAFMQTSGYIPLRYAYGMEEADVALQILDKGWQIIEVLDLQVFHDTELEHHASPEINAAHIANTALLAYLRYPAKYIILGILQVLNRLRYTLSQGRWDGILKGILLIPNLLYKYRSQRKPVTPQTMQLSRKLAKSSR